MLAALYHQRLHEARDRHDADAAVVMSELLKAADRYAHAYVADFANQGLATVHGRPDGGLVKARRLLVAADGRIVPAGAAQNVVLDQSQSYEAGTWQFTSGDVTISALISPERELSIQLPATIPHVAGTTLRYVPAELHRDAQGHAGGMRPFWLGATEVTYEQYLAFLRDPAVFAIMRNSLLDSYKLAENDEKTGGHATLTLVDLLPSNQAGHPPGTYH